MNWLYIAFVAVFYFTIIFEKPTRPGPLCKWDSKKTVPTVPRRWADWRPTFPWTK